MTPLQRAALFDVPMRVDRIVSHLLRGEKPTGHLIGREITRIRWAVNDALIADAGGWSTMSEFRVFTAEIEARAAASRAAHPDEAACCNCGFAISDHPPLAEPEPVEIEVAPRRICPTALFAVTQEQLAADVAAARQERREP